MKTAYSLQYTIPVVWDIIAVYGTHIYLAQSVCELIYKPEARVE